MVMDAWYNLLDHVILRWNCSAFVAFQVSKFRWRQLLCMASILWECSGCNYIIFVVFWMSLYFIFQERQLREEISVKMSERYDCAECKESLYGQKYILKDENSYCIKCYDALFSNNCEVCQVIIDCTSKVTFLTDIQSVKVTFWLFPPIFSPFMFADNPKLWSHKASFPPLSQTYMAYKPARGLV